MAETNYLAIPGGGGVDPPMIYLSFNGLQVMPYRSKRETTDFFSSVYPAISSIC